MVLVMALGMSQGLTWTAMNMPVVGSGALVLVDHLRTCEVSPYCPDYEPMKVPLVDAAVRYDCPFDGRVYILLIQNALYVPSMDYNLLPPFHDERGCCDCERHSQDTVG